jgi:hypothetical protein
VVGEAMNQAREVFFAVGGDTKSSGVAPGSIWVSPGEVGDVFFAAGADPKSFGVAPGRIWVSPGSVGGAFLPLGESKIVSGEGQSFSRKHDCELFDAMRRSFHL